MLTEARERSTGMVHEAQQKKAAIMAELDREQGALERKIQQLRGFERDYRSRLHDYIEGQLKDLETTAIEVPEGSGSEGQQESVQA